MATIPTPEQGKPILDFSAGTFDGNSYLFQSRNGATEHVSGDDVADYVNTSRIYNTLETESKTPVGAINEIKVQEASDIADVQAAIDDVVDDGFYHVGDVINITGFLGSCFANTTRLDLYVPLPKKIPTDATLTIAGFWRIIITNSQTSESSVLLDNVALSTIGTVLAVIREGGIGIRVALNSGVVANWSMGNAIAMNSNTITISQGE